MDDLKIEHGLNGVSFIHLNGKPVLSISRYGRHAQATALIELLLAAPELLSSLKDITAAVQRALETAKRGEPGAWVELERHAALALAQITKVQPPDNDVEPKG